MNYKIELSHHKFEQSIPKIDEYSFEYQAQCDAYIVSEMDFPCEWNLQRVVTSFLPNSNSRLSGLYLFQVSTRIYFPNFHIADAFPSACQLSKVFVSLELFLRKYTNIRKKSGLGYSWV